ncbi:MAG: hypothetical protein GX448_20330 [Planctomycetes bacterium]|nr:hypothetical protein [Planctomycetota bacterium]
MLKTSPRSRRPWISAVLGVLAVAAGMGVAKIRPVGTKAGLIQFDVVSELNMDEGFTNWVVFARYWVCREFYAVSVVWSEPHGGGMQDMKALVVFSDEAGFRVSDERYADWVPLNTVYPKPMAARDSFTHGAGFYELAEMRFAERDAMARRVYVADLEPLKGATRHSDEVADLRMAEDRAGEERKLAHARIRTTDGRIDSMELLDSHRQSLARIRYEYELNGGAARLASLVADLPVRAERLAINQQVTLHSVEGAQGKDRTFSRIKPVDHLSHQGGRTCKVTYGDVGVGDGNLRLPTRIEVRVAQDGRLLRSATLMNFRRVNLDKEQTWQAAKAFVDSTGEDRAYHQLAGKYLEYRPKLGSLRVDPNDLSFIRNLIARYPVPPKLPEFDESSPATVSEHRERPDEASTLDPAKHKERAEASRRQWQREMEQRKEQWEQFQRRPKPPRVEIGPDDTRVIRQLIAHYGKALAPVLSPDEMMDVAKKGAVSHAPSSRDRELMQLRSALEEILSYHRAARLPEDDPPKLDAQDREAIRRLQTHYTNLAAQEDRDLGGRLQAVHALIRLDELLKDHASFERDTLRYLEMLQAAGLNAMYMVGGYDNLETLAKAGEYERSNRLLSLWARKSAADSDTDNILRFARYEVCRAGRWWACVHLLDRFVHRPGLSPIERYEGLALRAIALDNLDKMLAGLQTTEGSRRRVQGQWVLSTTSRTDIARRVRPAVLEAVSAWEALGPARLDEAKPYSTINLPAHAMNRMGYRNATGLQETSAMLDAVVRERTGPTSIRRPQGSQ